MLDWIAIIPVLPLIGVAVNGFFGRRMSLRAVGTVACMTVGASFLIAVGAVVQLAGLAAGSRLHEVVVGTWMPLDGVSIGWSFALDPLSSVMVLVVAGVGFLIHVYSIGYMAHEEDYARFFTYLNLFMAMMLTLVLAGNMMVMFVGWEGVGLCSYLLIGFFYDRPFDERTGLSCADAGRKAFIVNRVGDFAFLIGVLYLAVTFGTLDFGAVSEAVTAGAGTHHGLLVAVGILLFLGACGKSAQIPLYVWLPDAMAGPTPVSALIHAATMVTAGVYMVARMSALYTAAPEAMAVVAAVGALTAIFAATMGMAATDIKKVLAYSTVSQLGYMFAACGVGAYVAGIFHLMTHAFFKGLLFLGAGSVIHGMSGDQDIRHMGGLRKKMPRTYWTFLVATLAIAGVPGLAGFFSKDEILAGAWSSGSRWVWGTLVLAAGITAFYMFRLTFLVFFGKFRGTEEQAHHVHESPSSMTVPLMVLALLAVAGGWIGIPKVMAFGADINYFHHWLEPSISAPHGAAAEGLSHAAEVAGDHVPSSATPHGVAMEGAPSVAAHGAAQEGGLSHTTVEWLLIGLAVAIAAVGILVAYRLYLARPGSAERVASRFGPLYHLVRNLYWVDELYDVVVLRPFYRLSKAFHWFDARIIDGAVNGARHVTLGLSFLSNFQDQWIVDGAVNLLAWITQAGHRVLSRLQTGMVQTYAAVMVFGVFVLIVLYTLAD